MSTDAGFAVLLVEDDPGIGRVVCNGLRHHGIEVDWLRDADEVLARVTAHAYAVVILDLMLPRTDGFRVCRLLRDHGLQVPVCMLTARDALDDKLEGFEAGADDYLTKPFAVDELAARLRALARRRHAGHQALAHGDLLIDVTTRQATITGETVALTRREFDTLAHLVAQAGKVVSREDLLDAVWDADSGVTANSVDVYVGYLRRKLSAAASTVRIEAVRGIGFRLV